MAQTYNQPTGDFVTTTLNGALSAGATTGTIGTGLNLPSTNGILMIDYDSTAALGVTSGPETTIYTTYTSGTGALTGLTRGSAGTTGVAHNNAASVSAAPSILYLNDLYNGNLAAASSSIGVSVGSIRQEAWTTWSSPTYTGFSAAPTQTLRYIKIGRSVTVEAGLTNSSGTSNATTFTMQLPFASALDWRVPVYAVDNTSTISVGRAECNNPAGTNLILSTSIGGAGWTGSGTKGVVFMITYESTT